MSNPSRTWRIPLVLATGLALVVPVMVPAGVTAVAVPVGRDHPAGIVSAAPLRSPPPKLKPGAAANYLRSVKALDDSLQTGLSGSAEATLMELADLQGEIVKLLNEGASVEAVDVQLQTAKLDGDAVGQLISAFPPMRRGLLKTIDGLASDCGNIPCRTMLDRQREALAPELTKHVTLVLPAIRRACYALAAKDFELYNTNVQAAYDAIADRRFGFHDVTLALSKPTRWRPETPTVGPLPPLAPVTP